MPPPRKLSPRRRDRRSRSHSPRRRRRSRSRSRSPKGRRRSRSPQRKRSPERRRRSLPRRRSPSPKKRSRSPKRRSRTHSPRRSRSRSPRRRIPSPKRSPPRRRSPSPVDRNYPIKRPADSSMKRHSFRSRSPSPTAVKRSRDERPRQDENPYEQQRPSKRSPSPLQETQYGGKMYADQPSSSSKQIFPAGSSKRREEIDFVTIVEKGQKKTKLHKRFETLEQVAQGPFDFEENITIGIHRGPQHIELDDDDDDVEVNYAFNTKTFKMLFSKKNYAKAIFDRKEILAFHLDDILDEEAYEEKRTISMKPIDKPRARKHDNDLDYKITVGSDGREGFGDRRMVHDSRSRPSRSGGYDDVPVTVRLDPKPDPRYEQLYREQQRYEEQPPMQDVVHRNPNDLRYNLMRRKSDGDRGDRGGRDPRDNRGDPVSQGMMDARSHIEARRQEIHPGEYPSRRERSGDRPGVHRASHRSQSPRGDGRKKAVTKTDLPDFKNRPEKFNVEPDWKENPTATPKGVGYYEHDSRSRDDMTFWERKQHFMKTGRMPVRGFRGGRGFRGRGRGSDVVPGFMSRTRVAAMDEWKHDKFDAADGDDTNSTTDKKDHKKDDGESNRKESTKESTRDIDTKSNRKYKDSSSRKDKDSSSRKDKDSSNRKDKDSSNRKDKAVSSRKDKVIDKEQEKLTIRKEEESLQEELKVEVTLG